MKINVQKYLGNYCNVVFDHTLVDGPHMRREIKMNITRPEQLEDKRIIAIRLIHKGLIKAPATARKIKF